MIFLFKTTPTIHLLFKKEIIQCRIIILKAAVKRLLLIYIVNFIKYAVTNGKMLYILLLNGIIK